MKPSNDGTCSQAEKTMEEWQQLGESIFVHSEYLMHKLLQTGGIYGMCQMYCVFDTVYAYHEKEGPL